MATRVRLRVRPTPCNPTLALYTHEVRSKERFTATLYVPVVNSVLRLRHISANAQRTLVKTHSCLSPPRLVLHHCMPPFLSELNSHLHTGSAASRARRLVFCFHELLCAALSCSHTSAALALYALALRHSSAVPFLYPFARGSFAKEGKPKKEGYF